MASAPEHIQSSFAGGFTRQFDTSKIGPDQYPLLINGRMRDDIIEPIRKPVRITNGLPAVPLNVQSLYASDIFALIFIDGKVFYRDFSVSSSAFVQISDFQMDASVATIFAELVPTSSVNFSRKAAGGNANNGVNLSSVTTASPACVVCQDGLNQPRLIFSNGTAVISKKFEDWSMANREYVPIGKQMLYSSEGILYIVSPNGKLMYRSVSGRPLDFIIAVDANGDKLPSEAESGAAALSHAVMYETITALIRVNSVEGFVVTSSKNTWLVKTNLNNLLYGEPTFTNQYYFNTGAVNHFSSCELIGDTTLIDINGVRSFNAVKNFNVEGQNSPFSKQINNIFKGINQPSWVCAITFDNYAFYSVQTIYGPAVLVYDTLGEVFVGLDIYEGIAAIKQFAEIKVGTTHKLLFITVDNKLYEAFASESFEKTSFYIGDFTSRNPKISLKPEQLQAVFLNSKQTGIVNATIYVDGKKQFALREAIRETITTIPNPQTIPFGDDVNDSVKTLSYNLTKSDSGWKVGVLLEWNFDTTLSMIRLQYNSEEQQNSFESQAVDYGRYSGATKIMLDRFAPASGPVGAVVVLTGMGLSNVTNVTLNNMQVTFTLIDDNAITFNVPAGATTGKIRLVSNYDEIESDSNFTVN